jgi:tetratricopeptide (TPR) repeat protein
MGIVAQYQGSFADAEALYEEALRIRQTLGNKWAIATSTLNLGYLSYAVGDYPTARARQETAVALYQELGDRWRTASALNNLGDAMRAQGEHAEARTLYEQGLRINRELGNQGAIAYLLESIGCLDLSEGKPSRALRLIGAAQALRETAGAPLAPSEENSLNQIVGPACAELGEEVRAREIGEGRRMTLEEAITLALGDR